MILPVRHHLPQKLALPILAMLFLASCGSSQQASYYEDGIYNQSTREAQVEKKTLGADNAKAQEPNTYKDYFGQRGKAYGKILDDEIFTDVNSYSGTAATDSIPAEQQTNYFTYNNTYAGNPGWGENPTSVTVTLYNNWGGGYGWGYPYWRYPYWGFRYGWRGHPYWGHGYGWGGYYGHPWYGPYYRPHYYRPYYYPKTYTYSATRRGYSNSARTGEKRANSNYFSRYRTSNSNTERYRSSGNSTSRRPSGTYRSSKNSSRVSPSGNGRRR